MENKGFAAPVNVGDELEVTIDSVGEKGDGIARKKGFVLFVPGTKTGDSVKIRVTKVIKKVGFAEKIGNAQPRKPSEREAQEIARDFKDEPQEQYEDTDDFGENLDE